MNSKLQADSQGGKKRVGTKGSKLYWIRFYTILFLCSYNLTRYFLIFSYFLLQYEKHWKYINFKLYIPFNSLSFFRTKMYLQKWEGGLICLLNSTPLKYYSLSVAWQNFGPSLLRLVNRLYTVIHKMQKTRTKVFLSATVSE